MPSRKHNGQTQLAHLTGVQSRDMESPLLTLLEKARMNFHNAGEYIGMETLCDPCPHRVFLLGLCRPTLLGLL